MFDVHEMRSDVRSTITVQPGGMIVIKTNYLGAIRITEKLPHSDTVHYYRVDKNAYPDDLAIGFKHVDEQHGYLKRYATAIADLASGFKSVWGYDVSMTVATDTEAGGFEVIFETRNMRSSVSIWSDRRRMETWEWNNGLRARKNVYLSTEFEDYFEAERLCMKNLRKWLEEVYTVDQEANQNRLQADVEHLSIQNQISNAA